MIPRVYIDTSGVTHNWRFDLQGRCTMSKDKTFDAVKIMRAIRDRTSEEMKGMSPREQIEYIENKSGFRKEGNKHAAISPNGGMQTR